MMPPPIHVQEVAAAEAIFGPEVPSSAPLRAGHIPTAVAMSPAPTQLRIGCPQLRTDSAAVAEERSSAESEHRAFHLIWELARRIRSPSSYVGYSFFVLLGITKQCQPVMWEGSHRTNLLEKFAPWALQSAVAACAVDGLVCCMRSLPSGRVELVPVSEDQPLSECQHFVACHKLPISLQCEGDSIEAFYGRLGVVLLNTAMDSNCGLDVACQMLGLPTKASCRDELRREIADYLLQWHESPWMYELLAACEELPMELVERIRSGGGSSAVAGFRSGGESSAVVEADSQPNVSSGSGRIVVGHEMEAVETVEALKWTMRIDDNGIVHGLLHSLPSWVLKQQVLHYRARACAPTPAPLSRKIKVNPKSLSVRDAVAQAFEEYLRSCGADSRERLPRGQVKAFVDLRLEWCCKGWKQPEKSVRRWHRAWTRAGKLATLPRLRQKRIVYAGALPQSRKRRFGAGKLALCNFVREGLFEWFVSMRYSIDWRKYNSSLKSVGRYKAIGRFPVAVLRDKAKQLLQEYLRVSLMQGHKRIGMAIDWKWLKRWEIEYGLSMRAPNRKFKVSKQILEERLTIWWLNLARVRALCEAVFGYDPEMENWDQSPFHHNEIGSQNARTLAVHGSIEVPLVEGHADTRLRWTANLTTFSNKERIERGDFPYAQFMFRAEGERLQERLREHVRSRGYPAWASASTSEKGSYREEDVLDFLDRHLPAMPQLRKELAAMPQSRGWRIAMADDLASHKTDNVRRLCWQRGYVLIVHGGGATPVAQTPDTDLNQHVRRIYSGKEAAYILNEMRKGIPLPRTEHTRCIDMMMEVLLDPQLHLHAADGYKKTGANVALDGSEDHLIVREAGEFFRRLNIREKINVEVSMVREEVKAGRLTWTAKDVASLIQSYPRRTQDDVFERLGEHHQLDANDPAWEDSPADEDAQSESMASDSDDGKMSKSRSAVADSDVESVETSADVGNSVGTAVAVDSPALSEAAASSLSDSEHMLRCLHHAIDSLRDCGAVTVIQHLDNEIRREERRQRMAAMEDSAVAAALRQLKANQAAIERRRRLAVDDANRREKELAKVRKDYQQTQELWRKRKQEIMAAEAILEEKNAPKRISPEMLGQGKPRSGGALARKHRFEVLDRLAQQGSGLSPAQRNDWSWFKEAWDTKMSEEHQMNWGGVFSGWTQKVIDDHSAGMDNAFSVFLENETVRNFKDKVMLVLPAAANP